MAKKQKLPAHGREKNIVKHVFWGNRYHPIPEVI